MILGQTMSGKTVTAKTLARDMKKRGMDVLVLDPLKDPSWEADFITDNAGLFMQKVFTTTNCLLIVDESGDAIGKYDTVTHKLATRSRHLGHIAVFCAQRLTQLNPTIRGQCSRLFLFNSSHSDCVILANEFNEPGLLAATELPPGTCLYKNRFAPLSKIKYF